MLLIRVVVPLLSDIRGGHKELSNSHHEYNLGSGNQLPCLIREKCLQSKLFARHGQCQNREETLPRSMSIRLWGKHEQKPSIPYAGNLMLSFTVLSRKMMPRRTCLAIFWLVLMGPCPHGTCLTQQLNGDEEC